MKILKYLIIFIILFVVVVIAGFIYSWTGRKGVTFSIPKITADLKIGEVHLTRTVAGRTEWELNARSADYFRERGVTRLDLPRVVFFAEGGRKIELNGDEGEVFNATNDLNISGKVKIVSSDGYTFLSDNLKYLSDKKVVTTDSPVTLRGNGIYIEGVGMLAEIERDRIFIKKRVKAVLKTGDVLNR